MTVAVRMMNTSTLGGLGRYLIFIVCKCSRPRRQHDGSGWLAARLVRWYDSDEQEVSRVGDSWCVSLMSLI